MRYTNSGGESYHGLKLSPQIARKIAVYIIDDVRQYNKQQKEEKERKILGSWGDEHLERKNNGDKITKSSRKGEIHHE